MKPILNLYLRANISGFIAAYSLHVFHKERIVVYIDTINLRYFYLNEGSLYIFYYDYDTTNVSYYFGK